MDKLQDLLNERISSGPSAKVKALAKQSASGNLTSFHGLFGSKELSEQEKQTLEQLLFDFKSENETDILRDLQALISITSEVKAITNQAALLHGERIRRVQTILKNYQEGAFSTWLVTAYGNRQTPYNFLLYYEFYESLSQDLKLRLEIMPRQAIYTLAARQAPLEHKQKIVAMYNGQTKQEMLELIRLEFPLANNDKRKSSVSQSILTSIEKQFEAYQKQRGEISRDQAQEIAKSLKKFLTVLENRN
jgi:hypothetical protein